MIVKIILVHKIDIKNVGPKIVCFKKFWVQKVLIVQKMFGPKILGFKNLLNPKNWLVVSYSEFSDQLWSEASALLWTKQNNSCHLILILYVSF